MVLILLLAVIAGVALAVVVLPLLRRTRTVAKPGDFDRAVYRDQLRELDRDILRGVLSESEAVGSRLEIQRRLLAANVVAGAVPGLARGGRSPMLASLVALAVAGGTAALYLALGAPSIPDTPFSAHLALAGEPAGDATPPAGHADVTGQHDLGQALQKLAAKLQADPSNADGWLLYARTAGSMRRWDAAVDGYRRAMALGRGGPMVQSGYGEMLTLQADGIVTPAAHDAFAAAVHDDPANDVARYYLGLAAGQAGEPQKAIDEFQTLLAEIPEDSPMREEIAKRIAEAAKAAGLPMPQLAKGTPAEAQNPDDAAMEAAAAVPSGEQKDMIAAMVAKLAARMAAEPGDADGWMRLGRAYVVLGERDKGADAYEHAVALKPGEVGIRLQAVEGMLTGLKPEDALPPRAMVMLRQVEAVAPEQPEVLWYLGIAAARDAHPAEAKRYWNKLLAELPADGDDAKMVKAAVNSLKGG
jgi:cytochrome c-type biogenesis protein CcmH